VKGGSQCSDSTWEKIDGGDDDIDDGGMVESLFNL
jgi:hypothetical protein